MGGGAISRRNFVVQNPKVAMWLTCAEVLACLHLELKKIELQLSRSAMDEYARLAHGGG